MRASNTLLPWGLLVSFSAVSWRAMGLLASGDAAPLVICLGFVMGIVAAISLGLYWVYSTPHRGKTEDH